MGANAPETCGLPVLLRGESDEPSNNKEEAAHSEHKTHQKSHQLKVPGALEQGVCCLLKEVQQGQESEWTYNE